MTELKYKFTYDVLFKLLFQKYPDLLKRLVAATLGITLDSISEFGCEEYCSEFGALELHRHELLSDKLAMLYFEVRKLPNVIDKENELELMLSLFRARTEEDLKKLEALEVAVVTQAIGAYREVVVSHEFRELERLRFEARSNEASALANAERRNTMTIAKRLLNRNRPIDEIMEDTGLTRAEVEDLRDT